MLARAAEAAADPDELPEHGEGGARRGRTQADEVRRGLPSALSHEL
jgi:hypothetical protein